MKQIEIAQKMLEKVDVDGEVTLTSGVFLQTTESLKEEQTHWSEYDPCKTMNLKVAPYWITSDNGIIPIPVYDAENLLYEMGYTDLEEEYL